MITTEDTVVWKNDWLSIVDRDGFYFLHENTRRGTVVVIPYRFDNNGHYEIMCRVEVCPAHSLNLLEKNAITGGIRHDCTSQFAAKEELLEEAGYAAEEREFFFLGSLYPSKMSDTFVIIYGVDVSNKEQQVPTTDGSKWEQNARVEWLNESEIVAVQDSNFIAGYFLLKQYLGLI